MDETFAFEGNRNRRGDRMKRILIGAIAASLTVIGGAFAEDSPIKQRQDIMKQNGDVVDKATKMMKGELPYDGAAVAEGLKKISAAMDKFPTLFPAGSGPESGVKTAALPAIWPNKADFDARAKQLQKDADAAAKAAPGGMDGFRTAFLAMGKTCQGCHEKYQKQP
jgi:cytochrome c556